MLDATVLNHLSDEQKARLVAFEKVFSSEGWQLIKKWAEATAKETEQRALFAPSWEENRTLFGKWFAYTEFTNLEDLTYQEFTGLAIQNQNTEIDEVEIEYDNA